MIIQFLKRIKNLFTRLLAEGSSPHSIALGFAVGIFIGALPIIGFQLIPTVIVCYKLKANKIAGLTATWISNAFTYIPLYYYEYLVGCLILPHYQVITKNTFKTLFIEVSFSKFVDVGEKLLVPLLVGSMLNAVVLSVSSYFIVKFIFTAYQRRIIHKR